LPTDGGLCALAVDESAAGIDAMNLTRELWNSEQAPGARDVIGHIAKFTPRTIAKGRVYVATSFEQGRCVRTYVLTTQPQVFTPGVISNTTLPSCREIRATSTGDVITVADPQLGAGLRSSAWTVTRSSVFDALVSRTS
jgi:hypothetical protein